MIRVGIYRQIWRAFGVALILCVSAFGAIAALRHYELIHALAPTITLATTTKQPQTPTLAWPSYGQAAIATQQQGVVATHDAQTPHPTASTAKVITVLAILEKRPLKLGEHGATLTMTERDVQSYDDYIAQDGSTTPVHAGLQLTQYQALQAIMLASSNNMADTLAIWAFGSLEAYHTYANQMVKRLGATHTTIGGDASGLNPLTTSTAEDMAHISLAALKHPVIAQIAAQQTADIPFAGTITNSNRLLIEHAEIVGLKTGQANEAGGNFLLAAKHTSAGQSQPVVVVVFGAESAKTAILDSYKLYQSARPYLAYEEILPAGTVVAQYDLLRKKTAHATLKQPLKLWTWSGRQPQPTIDLQPITGETADCAEVGSLKYEAVSVPLLLERANNSCPQG